LVLKILFLSIDATIYECLLVLYSLQLIVDTITIKTLGKTAIILKLSKYCGMIGLQKPVFRSRDKKKQ
jgi:hypothetical protein